MTLLLSPLLSARADDFLDPEQAFKLSVKPLDAKTVESCFEIASGYYMYRDQFHAEAQGATLGTLAIPAGKTKFDETFQKTVEIYRDRLCMKVPVSQAAGPFKLTVTGQGCADKGLCYPPMSATFDVRLLAFGGLASVTPSSLPATVDNSPAPAGALDAALQSRSFWLVVGLFFVGGIGLAFTPCVLPMLPILSAIIVGSGGTPTRGRSFALALAYSAGMSLIYTALGIAAGWLGEGLAAYFQLPAVLAAFGVALVLFALSMFGAYELSLPTAASTSLQQTSQRLQGGKLLAVFGMGAVSALIVSPCVSGILASGLLYIGKTHDLVLGGSALFALSWGMSVPLLLLGASAGALLPRAGAWMDGVKHCFGMLLLGVALWTVQPILPAALAQALWGALLVGTAAMLGLFQPAHAVHQPHTWLRKTAAVVAMVFGLLQLVGAAAGGTDPLKPLAGLGRAGGVGPTTSALSFQMVRSVAELDAAVAGAGRPVMLDFYADWCVSCKEMERDTFSDPAVRQRLAGALLLKADVTANGAADRELLKRFKLFGPPGTIFFDASGQERLGVRVIGFQNAERFLSSLAAAGL